MRIAAFDIETTDLKAFMGTLLCCSFQPILPPECKQPKAYTIALEIEPGNTDPNPDKELAMAIREELTKYDMVVSWNGKMFDVPFVNARLLKHRELPLQIKFHLDAMYCAGYSANRIGSKKLENVQQFLDLPSSKTKLDWDIWKMAMKGNGEALKQVIHHCEQDVKVLAEAYWRFLPYVRNLNRLG